MSIAIKYQIEREKHWNSKGIFRCIKDLECENQCEECNKYYENLLIKEKEKSKK